MKYSVIIPVYNSEKTVERCLQSLLAQDRNDVEIIVINDGSTDASGALLAEYASDHQNVLLIDQKNSGVSAARNAGIEKATGTYITFVDSDDYVSKYSIKPEISPIVLSSLGFTECFSSTAGFTLSKQRANTFSSFFTIMHKLMVAMSHLL